MLLDFKNDATLLTLLDKLNPIKIERISSIREYPHNFDEEKSGANDYLELSKIDLSIKNKDHFKNILQALLILCQQDEMSSSI